MTGQLLLLDRLARMNVPESTAVVLKHGQFCPQGTFRHVYRHFLFVTMG
jgi:hypothetical protein